MGQPNAGRYALNRTPYLEVSFRRDTPLLDVGLQALNRVLGAPHPLDLLAGTVGGSGVGHAESKPASSNVIGRTSRDMGTYE